mgnify:CR=1 FL=1
MTIISKTPISKKPNLYADFHKDLRISPISKDLALLKDEDAVKQSLKNQSIRDLVLFYFSRPFNTSTTELSL